MCCCGGNDCRGGDDAVQCVRVLFVSAQARGCVKCCIFVFE